MTARTGSMATIEWLVPPLSRLAKKCIDARLFRYAESFCNLLGAVDTGRWHELDADEQIHWLDRLDGLLDIRGLGESIDWNDPDYRQVRELVDGFRKSRRVSRRR